MNNVLKKPTYVVYDIETTGRSYFFDQILQISAVLYDESFIQVNEIDIRSKLSKGIIPHIKALETNKLTLVQLTQSNMSSYQVMCEVADTFKKWGPAMFIGHNSISFDENFLRLGLYKNLHNPYPTNTNGSQRGDSLLLARACSVFEPEAINIPTNEKGQSVFSLGSLAIANNIELINAHDALADVKATASLLSIIKKNAPELWGFFLLSTSKAGAQQFMQSHSYFCYAPTPNQAAVLRYCCMNSDPKKSESYHFNLKYDPKVVVDLDIGDLEKIVSKNIIIKKIKTNSAPILVDKTYAQKILNNAIDERTLIERSNIIFENKDFLERLSKAITNLNTVYPPGKYVEQQIYDGGFPSRHDEALMNYFHHAPLEEKFNLCLDFQNAKFKKLGLRILYYEYPNLLPKEIIEEIDNEIIERLNSLEKEPYLTVDNAINTFENEKEENPNLKPELILDYEKILESYV